MAKKKTKVVKKAKRRIIPTKAFGLDASWRDPVPAVPVPVPAVVVHVPIHKVKDPKWYDFLDWIWK